MHAKSVRFIDRVTQTCTMDLLGRRPSRFVGGLDAISPQLINHFANSGCYPEAIGPYWLQQGNFRAAIAIDRWLAMSRPSALVAVELHGFMERDYTRVRRYAVHIAEAGHERYVDPTGVYLVEDYARMLKRSLGITELETVVRPHDARAVAASGKSLIQAPPPVVEAVPVYRFLSGLFTPQVMAKSRKSSSLTEADFELPEHLYHATPQSNLRSILTVGLLAASCGKNHDLREHGSPTQGVYLSSSPVPGELEGEMPARFDRSVETSAWVILAVKARDLIDDNFRPDPASFDQALTDPCLSTPGRMARYLDITESRAMSLYDEIRRAGRPGFAWEGRRLWKWSMTRGQSVFYAGNIPKAQIEGSYRFHPRSAQHLQSQRYMSRSSTDGNSDFYIRKVKESEKLRAQRGIA